jgi:RND family efflux transporter MFP subunit
MDRCRTRNRCEVRWLSFGLLLTTYACHHEPPAPEEPPVGVHCVHPQRGDIDDILTVRGRLEPPPGGTLLVASQVAGRVVQLLAHEGQRTAQGEIVAIVDDLAARDALRQAEAALAQTKAAMTNADAALGRTRSLVDRGIAARQELEDAQAKSESARANVAATTAAADLAKRTLGRVQVRSSLAGIVTRVLRGPGAIVDGSAATPILELAASSALEFVGAVTQMDLSRLHPGQIATGVLLGTTPNLHGFVRALPSAIDPSTGLGTVRIALDEGSGPVGAYGQLQIIVDHHRNARLIPRSALRGAMVDGPEVVICKDGQAQLRSLKVGVHNELTVEVLSGMDDLESVAVDHVLGLSNDAQIRQMP